MGLNDKDTFTPPKAASGAGERRDMQHLEFLQMAALQMADESLGERELNSRISELVRDFIDDGIVIVASFVRERRSFRIEAIAGQGDILSRAIQGLGRDPLGMTFPVDDALPWTDMTSPVLNRVAGGLQDLVFGRLPPESVRQIEQALGMSQAWVMGLGLGGRIFGSIAILLPEAAQLPDPRVIETFVLIATSALQRRRAQDERRNALRDLRRGVLCRDGDGDTDLTATRIMDSSPVGILVLDRQGRIEFANRRAQTCLGPLVGELKAWECGSDGPILADHEGRLLEAADLPSRRVLATGHPVSGVRMAFQRPGGECLYAVISASPLLGRTGDVERVIETIEDVTSEVLAGRNLRDSRERFQRIVDEQVELICRFLPDGTLTFGNPAFCSHFGCLPSELVGVRAMSLVHPDDRQRRQRHLKGLTPRRPVGTIEHRVTSPGGEVCWLQWTDRATFDENGQPVEYQSVGRDITERRATEERLAWQATHDVVTSLPNRLLLSDRLASAMARSARNERLFAVALLDLDRFKDVNDTYGHAAGDALLKAVADRLRHVMRRSDTVARLGGDEFTLVIPDLKDLDVVDRFSQKVLRAFDAPFDIEGQALRVTASVGVAVGLGLTVDSDTLLRRADRAMYQAKRAGRNAVRLFEDVASHSLDAGD